ncbi:MAG: transposase [Reichenbachiella sp.]
MADSLSTLSQQNINHFINSDHWSSRNVMDQVAQQSSEMFSQDNCRVALLLDELGFRKKGNMSACVGRQYLGCIGKTDNGQVAVGAGLSQGRYFVPIDMRLFMPKAWQEDDWRRNRCNIPKSEKHVSKPSMALSMIQHAIDRGIKFDDVNFDALYGNATFLLEYLQDNGIDFIGDIRSDFMLHFSDDKGEKLRVDEYVARLSKNDFEKINIRKSTKGTLKASFHYACVQVLYQFNY